MPAPPRPPAGANKAAQLLLLLLAACLAGAAAPASAATVILDFGVEPSTYEASVGVIFSQFASQWSPPGSGQYHFKTDVTVGDSFRVPNGFVGAITFRYKSFGAGYFVVSSEEDGGGSNLAVVAMTVSSPDASGNRDFTVAATDAPTVITFEGVAKHVSLSVLGEDISIDSITFANLNPLPQCASLAANGQLTSYTTCTGSTDLVITAAGGTPPYTGIGTFPVSVSQLPYYFEVTDKIGCLTTVVSSTTSTLVQEFTFAGFYAPVDNAPVLNTIKAGQAVPIKFSLGCNAGLAVFAAGYPKAALTACPTVATVDPVETAASPGASTLSYDSTTGRYTWVWRSPTTASPNTCIKVLLRFVDATERYALFKVVK